jgi:protein FRA10AC1
MAKSSSDQLDTVSAGRTMEMSLADEAADYESVFDEDDDEAIQAKQRRAARFDLATKSSAKREAKATRSVFTEEATRESGRKLRSQFLEMNAYDRHKMLINEYVLYFPGATARLQRDTSSDKTDLDVIKENHRFLWDGEGSAEDKELTWGQRVAKKYYDRLFKEYCICDLSRYKENKIAMRWRTEKEVRAGKGQFQCGERKCEEAEGLRTWEVNFAYVERQEKKNALVKVRLCPDCSYKLNYHHKKKEVTKRKEQRKKRKSDNDLEKKRSEEKRQRREEEEREKKLDKQAVDIWSAPLEIEQEKSREEDFAEYLEDLFM